MGVVALDPSAPIQRCMGFVRNISNFHRYTASDFARWKGDQLRSHRQFWESFNAFRRLQNHSGGTLRGMVIPQMTTAWNAPTVTSCLHRTFTQFSSSRAAKFYWRDRALYCLYLSKEVFPRTAQNTYLCSSVLHRFPSTKALVSSTALNY